MSACFYSFYRLGKGSYHVYNQFLAIPPNFQPLPLRGGISGLEEEDSPSSSARANSIMSSGKISGIPPTLVDTTNKPAEAASMILIPNASVREVFKYI
jgi:hypothetical protein